MVSDYTRFDKDEKVIGGLDVFRLSEMQITDEVWASERVSESHRN